MRAKSKSLTTCNPSTVFRGKSGTGWGARQLICSWRSAAIEGGRAGHVLFAGAWDSGSREKVQTSREGPVGCLVDDVGLPSRKNYRVERSPSAEVAFRCNAES
jgi:hypothetical protein